MGKKEEPAKNPRFIDSGRWKKISRWIQWTLSIGVPVLLVYQLSRIGWGEIYASFPGHVLFYLILLVLFAALPISETLIYNHAFGVQFLAGLPFFFKKRVYNHDLLNYSGEVYLYLWAEKTFGFAKRRVLGTIKDNNIVSAIASTAFAVAVLGLLVVTKNIVLPDAIANATWIQIVLVLVVTVILAVLLVRFRHAIFFMGTRSLARFFLIHFSRLVLVSTLQVVQWAVVLPDTHLSILFTLLSIQIVANRIPMLPVRDLIFMGISVQLTGALQVSSASVAGMLLVSSVINRLMNVMILFLVGVHELRGERSKMNLADLESAREELAETPVNHPAED